MEKSTRPIENGTVANNNNPKPAPQGNGRNASRMPTGAAHSAVRRPSDTQRRTTAPNAAQKKAPVGNEKSGTQRPIAAQRQPIRQVTENHGSGMVLGTQPVAAQNPKRERKNDYIPTRKSRIKEPMPLATIVFSILCTVLVMFMMINFVKINEYTHDIADMQSELQKLERQEQELTVELEKKNDLTGVDLDLYIFDGNI